MKEIALLAAAAMLALAPPAAADVVGTPRVVDGQTLEVAGKRFRLYGIDAPDLDQTCQIRGRTYDCGRIARTALMDLVAGVAVRCRPVAGETAAGANVAACFAGGYDLSEGMVYTGWAMAAPRDGGRFGRIQKGAEAARRGLWKGRFVKPSAWRARHGADRRDEPPHSVR